MGRGPEGVRRDRRRRAPKCLFFLLGRFGTALPLGSCQEGRSGRNTTMMLKIAVALALVLGTAQAAESLKPLSGETVVSFQCRAAIIPEVRQCAQQCGAAGDADARWECVHSCTTRGLWDMAQCRGNGAPASSAVASR